MSCDGGFFCRIRDGAFELRGGEIEECQTYASVLYAEPYGVALVSKID